MNFLGIGPLEITIILILAFLFFGPEKLPGMAAKAGRLYRNFRKATTDLSKTITDEVSPEIDIREDLASIGRALTEDVNPKKESESKTTSQPIPMAIPESDKKWIEESAGKTTATKAAPETDNRANSESTEHTKPTAKSGKKRATRKKADKITTEPPLYEENM